MLIRFIDPPAGAIGIAHPENCWLPLFDLTLTPEDRQKQFGHWVYPFLPSNQASLRTNNHLGDMLLEARRSVYTRV